MRAADAMDARERVCSIIRGHFERIIGTGKRRFYAAVVITAAFFSLLLAVQALWIPLKAELAQWLLQRSWQDILAGKTEARPWPWADTRPLAVLQVPEHGIEQWVLEGHSGRNLAFGPVLVNSGAQFTDRIISGHRDTHFRFLERLQPGDRIELQTAVGREEYVVMQTDIVDSRAQELVIDPGILRLSLVTCFPFNATEAGGPMRYVVTALPASVPRPDGRNLKLQTRSSSSG